MDGITESRDKQQMIQAIKPSDTQTARALPALAV
jgi:hypothetical protein